MQAQQIKYSYIHQTIDVQQLKIYDEIKTKKITFSAAVPKSRIPPAHPKIIH